jgi:hypothetical protein
MSLYDETLTREPSGAYWYDSVSPVRPPDYEERFSIKRKGDDWQFIDESYSLTPYPGYEVDPKWVLAIQRIDPELCPVWIRLVFLSPTGSREVFTRLGLGRTFTNPDHINHDEELKDIVLPTNKLPWKVMKPDIMAAVFRDPHDPDVIPGIPVKPFVGFSQNVVDEIKTQHDAWRDAEQAEADVERMAQQSADRDKAKLEKVQAEGDYAWDHDNRHKNWHAEIRDMPGRELEEAAAVTRGKA